MHPLVASRAAMHLSTYNSRFCRTRPLASALVELDFWGAPVQRFGPKGNASACRLACSNAVIDVQLTILSNATASKCIGRARLLGGPSPAHWAKRKCIRLSPRVQQCSYRRTTHDSVERDR